MDPTVALAEALTLFYEMSKEPSREKRMEAVERLNGLLTWMERGGFAPNVSEAIEKFVSGVRTMDFQSWGEPQLSIEELKKKGLL